MTTPDDAPDLTLDEYAPGSAVALTDAERWPTLDDAGRAALDAVRDHPAAPAWVHVTGDRLRPDDLPVLDEVAARLAAGRADTRPGTRVEAADDTRPGTRAEGPAAPSGVAAAPSAPPAWVGALVDRAHAVVPRYRRARDRGESRAGSPLTAVPPVTRDDLRHDVASFVPVDVPLGRVLEGTSSGSTGAAVRVPLHPVAVAADLVLLQHLVASTGADWEPAPGRLGLMNLVDQREAFTYASAMTGFRRGPGVAAPTMARVNLDPGAWTRPGDRAAFLAAQDPQVVSSSPLPLLALARLAHEGLALHPVALVSGAAHLSGVARARLHATWDVPVVDLYGLRETGAVAARTDGGPFVVVGGRRVWVEILDDDGVPVPDGGLGEVVVTVDENPYLPLLRYRTGDRARIVRRGDQVELHDLEGRSPVRYLRPDGAWVPSVDAAQHLQAHGMAAWQLHQAADGSVVLDVVPDAPGDAGARAARAAGDAVGHLLGRRVAVREVSPARLGAGRARRWSSDVPGGAA
ncbi:AMP-dependent synthetase [Cellulosimicrobium cellulans]|uniref:AMP-dependent synthetase n=1 Tax=Cellulosimicrobium cellulans TaxID=1710 RepID=UPI002097C443|nr:AMP-dependent synthetase [Cellulosimicrobium cellulans]MCO7274534.1 AMP-dependent synthetase [Cellulosimicrobium cellulans]